MCFSATASFMAAATTAVVGLAAIKRTRDPRERPLAAMPLLFAFQQVIEGSLWLTLPVDPDAPRATALALVFLLLAKVFWPIYAPVSALLVEPEGPRRRVMSAILAGGAVSAAWLLAATLATKPAASIVGGHIVYGPRVDLPLPVLLLYMTATCAALVLSSHGAVRLLGMIVVAGAVVTYVNYWKAFTSVWCFFAAAASVTILIHFLRARRAPSGLIEG